MTLRTSKFVDNSLIGNGEGKAGEIAKANPTPIGAAQGLRLLTCGQRVCKPAIEGVKRDAEMAISVPHGRQLFADLDLYSQLLPDFPLKTFSQ